MRTHTSSPPVAPQTVSTSCASANLAASPYANAYCASDPLLAIPGRDVCSSQIGGLIRLLYMSEPSRQDLLWR